MLSWNDIPWILAGRRQVSELEYLDLETDICKHQDSSLILVPFPLKKEPFAEQMCSKLSGTIASYTNEQDLDLIINFLANKDNLNENGCIKKIDETDDQFIITVGVDGKLDGGNFLNPSKGTKISHLPWEKGRPWGGMHQCLFLSLTIQDMGSYSPKVTSVSIRDEGCSDFNEGCFLCVNTNPATKLFVRGLCPSSKLDKTYMLKTQADGKPVYLGQHTSFLYFDEGQER